MKKLLIFLLIIPFLIHPTPTPVSAEKESGYLRVIDESTAFYKNVTDTTPLFILPYTYYVKVIGESGDFYHVEYGGENSTAIDGYVKKEALFFDGLSADYRFPNLKITTATTAVLYEDGSLSTSLQYLFSGRELFFYGKSAAPDGSALYFVSYFNRLGFIKESEVVPFTLPTHPNPFTFIPEPEPETPPVVDETPEPETPTANNAYALQIIIIAFLAFAGIFGLIVAFKNKSIKISGSYYDENEVE